MSRIETTDQYTVLTHQQTTISTVYTLHHIHSQLANKGSITTPSVQRLYYTIEASIAALPYIKQDDPQQSTPAERNSSLATTGDSDDDIDYDDDDDNEARLLC